MKVTTKTENECLAAGLLQPGWYPFTINQAEEKTSKKGNEMIEVNVRVYNGNGSSFINDYLMDTEFGAYKLRHISSTCDILDQYEAGGINAEDLEGKEGFCKVGIQKDKTGQYPDRNTINDYAKEAPKPKGEAVHPGITADNDEDDFS